MRRSYAIIGAGGMGLYLGSLLQRTADVDVYFLIRSDYEHILNHGIKFESYNDNFLLNAKDIKIYNNINKLPKCDVILPLVKGNDIEHILHGLSPIFKKNGVVLVLQNGIGVEEIFSRVIPKSQIISGVCAIKSTKIGPGHVYHRFGNQIDLGYYIPHNDKSFIYEVINDFQKASIDAKLAKDIFYTKWIKLSFTIPTFALSVIYNSPTQTLLEKYFNQLVVLGNEVTKIAELFGYFIDIYKLLKDSINILHNITPIYPSMFDDYKNNQAMELDTTFGNLLSIAKVNNIQTPNIQKAYDKLILLENQNLLKTAVQNG